MIKIDDKLLEYASKYEKKFGVSLSLRMFPQTLTNEELYKAIDDCVDRNVNDLESKYFLCTEDGVLL